MGFRFSNNVLVGVTCRLDGVDAGRSLAESHSSTPTTMAGHGTERRYTIAVLPGDGIGLEVMPPALRCLEAASKRFGFALEFRQFDWASCTYYHKHGQMMPNDWKSLLQQCDAIYFGAVGDPKTVPDHISLWGSLIAL